MKKLILSVGALLFLGLLPATAIERSSESIDISLIQARSLEPNHAMIVTPLVADIEVVPGAKTTFSRSYFINANVSDNMLISSLNDLKMRAIFEFSDQEGADIIVSPLFSIETELDPITGANVSKRLTREVYQIKVNVKVKGTPAKYVNMRKAKETDAWIQDIQKKSDEKDSVKAKNTKVSKEKIILRDE